MSSLAIIAEKQLGKSAFAKHASLKRRIQRIDAAVTGHPRLADLEALSQRVNAIAELLFEYSREADPNEKKNILHTLDEIAKDEPFVLPTQTVEEWDDELAKGDKAYSNLRKRDDRRIKIFLKSYFSLRAKSGMRTQADVAKKSGLSRSHVASLESGAHYPQQQTLQKLAKAFGVDVSDLM